MAQSDAAARAAADETKYKGVRKRKWGKWVSEIRLPHSRERIWLGSYDSAEKAARAFDAAQFCLRGPSAKFNFPNNPPEITGGQSMSPAEIQLAATRYANANTSSSTSRMAVSEDQETPPSSYGLSPYDGTNTSPVEESSSSYSMIYDSTTYYQGDGSYSSSSYRSNLDQLTTFGSGNYANDFEMMSAGITDFYGAPQHVQNYDYEVDDSGGGSYLWNF